MEVSGQLYAPVALPPRKEPLSAIGYEAGWAPEPVLTQYIPCLIKHQATILTGLAYKIWYSSNMYSDCCFSYVYSA